MGIPSIFWPSTGVTSDGIRFGPVSPLYVGGSKVTIGVRCYRTHQPAGSNDGRLIAFANGVNTANHSLMIGELSSQFRVRIKTGASTSTYVSANGVFLDETYYDWVVTYDGATVRLYRNGVEMTSGAFPATETGALEAVTSMNLTIGNNQTGGNRPFGGHLADPFTDWHVWEPARVAAYHAGEDLSNLIVAGDFWSRLDEWPDGSGASRGIANGAQGSPIGFGETLGPLEGRTMPGIDRRAFVQVTFQDFPVLDAGTAGSVLLRVIGEAAQGAEGRTSPRALARPLAETAQASEALIPARALARARMDTVETTESVVDSLAAIIVRAVAETRQATESLARTLGLIRAWTDSVQTAEAKARARSLTRPVAERADKSEGAFGSRLLAQLATEMSEGVEMRLRALLLTRTAGETANPTESAAQVRNFAEGAKMVIDLVGQVALATPLSALRRTVIRLTGKTDN